MPDPTHTDTTPPPQAAPEAVAPSGETSPTSGAASGAAETAPTISERARFKAEQSRFRKQRAEFDRQQAEREQRHQGQLSQVMQQVQALEARLKESDSKLARFGDNPLEGLTHEQREIAIKRFALDGTPEGKAIAENAALRKTIDELSGNYKALRESIDQREKEREERAKQAQAGQYQSSQRQAIENVLTAILNEKDEHGGPTCPYLLAEYTAAEIREQLRKVQEYGRENGRDYPFSEIKSFLEKSAKTVYEKKYERRKAFDASREAVPPAKGGGGVAPRKEQAGNGHRGNAGPVQATRRSPTSRAQTRAEQEAHDVAMLRQAREKDAAARAREAKKPTH